MGPGSAAHRTGRCFASPGALRCVRGTRAEFISYAHPIQSRARRTALAAHRARALLHPPPPKVPRAQGRPGAGWHPRSTVRNCATRSLHSGIQVKPNIRPSLRSGLTAYVVISPGSDALLPPSPCGSLMLRARSGRSITAALGAQTPGARTTRFCRTQAAPVVCAHAVAHGVTRPATAFAPTPPASTTSPPACRDDRDTPLGPGWDGRKHALIPNSCKANCFALRALTMVWRVLPAGQRNGLWVARGAPATPRPRSGLPMARKCVTMASARLKSRMVKG